MPQPAKGIHAQMSSSTTDPITPAPAPWKLKGTVYTFLTYTTSKNAAKIDSMTSFMYSPLEAQSSFATGKFVGGIGMVQVIRYSDTPVGPYDELLLAPGSFKYRAGDISGSGESMKEQANARVTRIYVSQKQTCWNGRKNWNIPKHLARFEFKLLPGNKLSITVYPYEEESNPAPIFTAIYQSISYLPRFPISTSLAKYIGQDLRLAQPPLPQGSVNAEELVGTDKWCRVMPYQFSSKTSLGWWDLKQTATSNNANFWPGIGRWRIGAMMEDATIEFPEPERWDGLDR